MAIKKRNESPSKPVGEGSFSAVIEAAQLRELCFGTHGCGFNWMVPRMPALKLGNTD